MVSEFSDWIQKIQIRIFQNGFRIFRMVSEYSDWIQKIQIQIFQNGFRRFRMESEYSDFSERAYVSRNGFQNFQNIQNNQKIQIPNVQIGFPDAEFADWPDEMQM